MDDITAFRNCGLGQEAVRQNLSRMKPPGNCPSPEPIATDAVEAAAERIAVGSFRVVQDIFEN